MTITKSVALRTAEERLSAQALIAPTRRCRLHVRVVGICVCVEMHNMRSEGSVCRVPTGGCAAERIQEPQNKSTGRPRAGR